MFSGGFQVEKTRVVPLQVLKQKQSLHFFPKPKYSPKEIAKIFSNYRSFIMKESPDIIHLHDYSEASMPAISVGHALGIPIIQHLHSLIDESYPKDLVANFKNLRHFICVSVAVKDSLDLALGYESKAQVLPNAIPSIPVSDSDVGRTKNHILMVGRCVPSKGFDVGIRVLENLRKEGVPATLEIIGIGPSLGTLIATSKHNGSSEYIHFAKLKTREEIFSSMHRASVMLIPSQSQEGFSLVALEAAMCGLPVVATDIGGLPETICDQSTGFIVQANDIVKLTEKVKLLLNDEELARKMGEEARLRQQSEYNYGNYVESVNTLYSNVIAHR